MTVYKTIGPFTEIQMMPDEIDYVVSCIKEMPSCGLFVEWGGGGSSALWLDEMKDTQNLISIEHNPHWYEKISLIQQDNFTPIFADIRSVHFEHGYGTPDEETPFNVAKYVCPTDEIYDGDIYFIDGIARGACIASILLNRRNPDSIILLHDFSLREPAYNWITQFRRIEHIGQTMIRIF